MGSAEDDWAYDKKRGLLDATGEEYVAATGFADAGEAMAGQKGAPSTGVFDEGAELFFGELGIGYAAQGPEAGEHEGPANAMTLPLGVGTQAQLIAWGRALRTDDDFFPESEIVSGVWIALLPTVKGRVPWERREEELEAPILILEGDIPEEVLEGGVQIMRVVSVTTH